MYPVRFLITVAFVGRGSRFWALASKDCPTGPAEQFILRVIFLHGPLPTCWTWGQPPNFGPCTWGGFGTSFLGDEPALFRALDLGHDNSKMVIAQEFDSEVRSDNRRYHE